MSASKIPLPPAVQPHELQYRILREKQLLERMGQQQEGEPSEGRRSTSRRGGSESASQRSKRYAVNPETLSVRTSSSRAGTAARTASTSRSGVSISSSVALGKLNKLEEMLLEERKARQGAESMLLSLQKERVAREDAVRQSQATKKQLDDLMSALRMVVQQPDNVGNVHKLQSLMDATHVDPATFRRLKAEAAAADGSSGANRFAQNGTSLAPPVDSKYTKKVAHALPDIHASSGGGSDRGGRNFLDSMGQYERAREKNRLEERARRR